MYLSTELEKNSKNEASNLFHMSCMISTMTGTSRVRGKSNHFKYVSFVDGKCVVMALLETMTKSTFSYQ